MSVHLDPVSLLKTTGYFGLFLIIFAESGLLVGIVFPGDSLLFTAGFLASQGVLHLQWVVLAAVVGAIAGVSCGYSLGKRFGHRIFNRDDSLLFNKEYVERSEQFYKDHGRKTIVLARFIPVVRTLAPIVAGIADMPYRLFITFNIIGGLLWGAGVPLLGYYLGKRIPNIDHYLLPIVLGVIALSVLPSAIHLLRNAEHRQKVKHLAKQTLRRRRPKS